MFIIIVFGRIFCKCHIEQLFDGEFQLFSVTDDFLSTSWIHYLEKFVDFSNYNLSFFSLTLLEFTGCILKL